MAVRSWGRLNPPGDNAVLVCHALTGSADVDDWWERLLGPGRALDPEKDFIVATIGTPASHSPWAVGLADAQRTAIRSDAAWKDGKYVPGNPPREGLAIARMLAMCTYRSPGSFKLRFDRERHPAGHLRCGLPGEGRPSNLNL